MNYVEAEVDILKQVLTPDDIKHWKAHPRPKIELVDSSASDEEADEVERPKTVWTIAKSIF